MRLIGVNIPDAKRVEVSLTYIFGIGSRIARDILKATKINPDKHAKDLSPEEVSKLKEYIEKNYKIEGDLKREKIQNIKHKREIGSYQGLRHIKGLPVRGQKTKTNSRTVRGNVRKTMGSGRKPAASKT
jgi:small subunit ribosomal protein S13